MDCLLFYNTKKKALMNKIHYTNTKVRKSFEEKSCLFIIILTVVDFMII